MGYFFLTMQFMKLTGTSNISNLNVSISFVPVIDVPQHSTEDVVIPHSFYKILSNFIRFQCANVKHLILLYAHVIH